MRARPLSPHLSVYRFFYTMILSLTHRATGVALSVGLIVMVLWLVGLGGGESSYEWTVGLCSNLLVRLVLFGLMVSFIYHLANGVRHLAWDWLVGLDKVRARRSAWVVVGFTLACTGWFGYLLFCPRAVTP